MKNKGFTLIELLGVLILLGAVALVTLPAILRQIDNSQNDLDEKTEMIIISAARDYIEDNINSYDISYGEVYCILVEDLVLSGNLKESFISDSDIDYNSMKVRFTYNNGFEYDVVNGNECN